MKEGKNVLFLKIVFFKVEFGESILLFFKILRALMQLDLRQFQLKVEGLTRLRPLPDATKVELYVKAFYLPETALDDFCREHSVLGIFKLDYGIRNVFQ